MNIYVCINREMGHSPTGGSSIVASAAGTPPYGIPTTSIAVSLRTRQISKKIAEILATANPTLRCARVNAIHFPRAIIHQQMLLRALCTQSEKFPAITQFLSDFFRFCSGRTTAKCQAGWPGLEQDAKPRWVTALPDRLR
jgi:hypothetical protein